MLINSGFSEQPQTLNQPGGIIVQKNLLMFSELNSASLEFLKFSFFLLLEIRHIDFSETKQTNLQGMLFIILPIFFLT